MAASEARPVKRGRTARLNHYVGPPVHVLVGARISVFWPDDDAFYKARRHVVPCRPHLSAQLPKHTVGALLKCQLRAKNQSATKQSLCTGGKSAAAALCCVRHPFLALRGVRGGPGRGAFWRWWARRGSAACCTMTTCRSA